jgi:hypothetical protein
MLSRPKKAWLRSGDTLRLLFGWNVHYYIWPRVKRFEFGRYGGEFHLRFGCHQLVVTKLPF